MASRSPSPASDTSDSLQLDPSTLALLDSFLASKSDAQQRYAELEQAANGHEEKPMMSVDEYRAAFGEDWQLSQFWYSTKFATTLARSLRTLCDEDTSIAFLCCPTAFVAFQHTNPLPGARLLEVDQRFHVLAPKHYIPYDLDEPDDIPDALRGSVDIAVLDPPFLNETTNQKLAQTLKQILRPNAKLVLITSTSIETALRRIYAEPPLGPLRSTALAPEHGQLQNDFHCWGSWAGAEELGRGIDE
ncbi:hypothetical protein CYLTODRAFT_242898 [Cylindrobasidium torrendii FP15055 ss-10]|uniref:Protein-lysine N-methyltransferase EFM5 n=1 Tax=Cylindrobasidium torrendii FP15055 ss-10 TaxID=1314674 RepID=A0A0D7BG93_9AGAR|nr:hypothetical protein CYLTODRAFT_242898 [Cylindrobasidium torrendii FP15055 ss-10]